MTKTKQPAKCLDMLILSTLITVGIGCASNNRSEMLPIIQAARDTESGQIVLLEGGQPILKYNFSTVEPDELLKFSAENLKYARPRSNYIHPLYGFDGEELTYDWSVEHPHHRGIYWAWPEVQLGEETGDLHALQRVFARPSGDAKLTSGNDFGQIEAENLWLWEDKTPIVREIAIIRAYRSKEHGRYVDLWFQFTALADEVTVARRGTDKYGGLNVRLARVEDQVITFHTDAKGSNPTMAWAELSGIFGGGTSLTGLSIIQNEANPDYPGDWIEYPELNWFQPTFPASQTRFPLRTGEPLVLQYRLWIHRGRADEELHAEVWRDYKGIKAPHASD